MIASVVKNLLLLDVGVTMAMTTIMIPALTGLNQENNPNEPILITPEDSTWLGKTLCLGYVLDKVVLAVIESFQLLLAISSCQSGHFYLVG